MRAKYVFLVCLFGMLLGLANQGRGLAVSSESSRGLHSRFNYDLTQSRDVRSGTTGAKAIPLTTPVPGLVASPLAVTHSANHSLKGTGVKSAQTGMALSLSVDGAQNPERIPDHVAYRHFINVTAVSATASKAEMARRDAFLGRLKLSASDRASYVAALSNVREELTVIDRHGEFQSHAAAAAVDSADDFRRRRGRLLDDATARLLVSLSPDAVQRLQAHINEHVKRRIRIYGQAQ